MSSKSHATFNNTQHLYEDLFATPETTNGRLGTSTQTIPEGNAANTNLKRTNNTQSIAGANSVVIRTMNFLIAWFFGGKKSHTLCKNNSVRKNANDRLLKTLVSTLPSGIDWEDVPIPCVVSGMDNCRTLNGGVRCTLILPG